MAIRVEPQITIKCLVNSIANAPQPNVSTTPINLNRGLNGTHTHTRTHAHIHTHTRMGKSFLRSCVQGFSASNCAMLGLHQAGSSSSRLGATPVDGEVLKDQEAWEPTRTETHSSKSVPAG
eukprot:4111475-Amphidinium_carterae.1